MAAPVTIASTAAPMATSFGAMPAMTVCSAAMAMTGPMVAWAMTSSLAARAMTRALRRHGPGPVAGPILSLAAKANDLSYGGKGDDCLLDGKGNDTLKGGADGDDFVFGYGEDTNGDGVCDVTNGSISNNVILDFDADQEDRVVFHTMFQGTLSAAIIGDDVKISTSLGGSVLIKGLVTEMEGIDPTDPFFNAAALLDFLTKPGIGRRRQGHHLVRRQVREHCALRRGRN